MASVVRNADGSTREVKNLGWLLRNWKRAEGFAWYWEPARYGGSNGLFLAEMSGGQAYETDFADFTVFLRWIDRPVFRGLHVRVHAGRAPAWAGGIEGDFVIGSPEYRTMRNDVGKALCAAASARLARLARFP